MVKSIFLTISLIATTIAPLSIAKVIAPESQPSALENTINAAPKETEKNISSTPTSPRTLLVWVTAYSSTPEETDDTPFITASGIEVQEGIIATNFLPFGTMIKIPALFGDEIFVVQDRMHRRKNNFIDIWMPTKEAAEQFGIYYTDIVILN